MWPNDMLVFRFVMLVAVSTIALVENKVDAECEDHRIGTSDSKISVSLDGSCDDEHCKDFIFNKDNLDDLEKYIYDFVQERLSRSSQIVTHLQIATSSDITTDRDATPSLTTEPPEITLPITDNQSDSPSANKGTNLAGNITTQGDPLVLKGCPQSNYGFSSLGKQYIVVNISIPDLDEVSICARVRPMGGNPLNGAILSYSNEDEGDKAMWLAFEDDGTKLHVHGNSHIAHFNISNTTYSSHICFLVEKDIVWLYQNSTTVPSNNLAGIIKGRGTLVIGQKQKGKNPLNFKTDKAFSGIIENLMMWNRTLTHDEMDAMYENKCNCASDYFVALTRENVVIHGEIAIGETENC